MGLTEARMAQAKEKSVLPNGRHKLRGEWRNFVQITPVHVILCLKDCFSKLAFLCYHYVCIYFTCFITEIKAYA